MASLEVWVAKMMIGPTDPGGLVAVCSHWIGFLEAVQFELTDEACEVSRIEGISCVQGRGALRQDLSLEDVLINDDGIAVGVPADGFVFWIVHQMPQFGRKDMRMDAVWE